MTTEKEFICSVCGHSEDSKKISYDPLGFPICPVCGESDNSVQRTTDRAE